MPNCIPASTQHLKTKTRFLESRQNLNAIRSFTITKFQTPFQISKTSSWKTGRHEGDSSTANYKYTGHFCVMAAYHRGDAGPVTTDFTGTQQTIRTSKAVFTSCLRCMVSVYTEKTPMYTLSPKCYISQMENQKEQKNANNGMEKLSRLRNAIQPCPVNKH